LTDADFAELWACVSGERAPRALFAADRLAAGGDDAVRRLRAALRPPARGGPPVEDLVARLDDDDFAVREKATRALTERGEGVIPKLRAALDEATSAEVRARIARVLQHFNEERPSPERLRAARAVVALSRIDTAASRELLAEIADGPEAAPQTSAAKAALAEAEKSPGK
jgi:hypothetical protein